MREQAYVLIILIIFTNTISCNPGFNTSANSGLAHSDFAKAVILKKRLANHTLLLTESTLNDDPHWVKYNPADGPLPADAIVGGYGGYQNETLYIARAPHVGSLTPGKYVPSTQKAIISWGWWSHVKTKFEILCGRNYKWVPTTTDNIPEGAVVGGYIQNSYEPLYVGRVHYSGQILPGKVAVSHGVLYFGYEDREIDVKNFEILVKTTDSSPDDNPHWVKYNPANNTLPADAIVGGYENETLYIARAPYVGSLTPGKYIPSMHRAIISWGWLSHVKTEFEILCGRNYKWVPTTTQNIPEGAVVGGYIQNSYEPLYVGRVHYKGQVTIPGKVAVSHKVMYFAYGAKEIDVKYFEILVKTSKPAPREYPHWVKYNPADGPLPTDAIVGGYQNETLYIARAPHVGSLTPGKYVPSTHKAIISWGWWSHVKTEFEILVGHNYTWVPTTVHYIPDGAVVGGYIQDSYEPLFVGRVHYLGHILPGKVAVSHGVLYFGYEDREIDAINFEILVFDDKVKEKPKISGEYNVTATNGQAVNIACEVTEGEPKPLISWRFRGKTQSRFVSVPGSDSTLNISHVNMSDAGTYKCVATNDVGDDEHDTELIVQKSTIFDAKPHWVQFNPATDELPADAIVGGYQNETLYIARAPHQGSLTPGMYVPSTHKAYVTWSSDAHPKTVFEILCGQNYQWIPTTTDTIPGGAVVGGYVENSHETEYVGRTNYSGYVIPGKVAVSHGVLYFAYKGKTTSVRNFEILVQKKSPVISGSSRRMALTGEFINIECSVVEGIPKPTISWLFKPKNESSFMSVPGSYNVLRLMNVSTTDAGTYKCVANNDVGHDEHLTELMVPEGTIDPYWFSFDPNVDALPNDAIVGGYENETLYIALAEHEESINPGIYVPSKHKAYITWGNDTHPKNSFKILRGDNYIWVPTTMGHIPVNAFRGGYIENTYETLYICKANYSGHVISSKVAVSQGVCYIFYGGKTKPVRNFEILVVPEKTTDSSPDDNPHWVKYNPANNTLPADAIVGGYENETLYIARAPYVGSLTPGKYVPSMHRAIISWGWLSHVKTEFEILCGRNYKWVPTTTQNIPEGAVVGGYIQNSYEPLYVGRVHYKGQVTIPGKVAVSHKVMYFAYGAKEIDVKYFEILVKTSKPAPREYPHWVKYNPADGPLPTDAIVGGYGGYQNETLYIARAPHVGSLTPGKYVPSTHKAIISWGWWSHVKTEFEILVGHNYKWVPTTVHYIPDGAVVGGYIQDSYEPLFVGRVHYLGQILPGKVAVSHGVLYFGYEDREIDAINFEILVFDDKVKEKPKISGEYNVTATNGQGVNIACKVTEGEPKPLISWRFRGKTQSRFVSVPGSDSTLNISHVNMSDAGTYKCVATNDVGDDEHDTELIVQKSTIFDAKPHWVQFNPATDELPADAIVGGYQNETLYIARAPHQGSLTPGMYVPSTHKAYVTWSSDAHPKTVFEILCGQNYQWIPTTTDTIPGGAVVGGYVENSHETEYVGRTNYSGYVIPGKVAVSHGVLYFAYKGKTTSVRNFEILVQKKSPVISGSSRRMALTGEFINIECSVVEGIPKPTISWLFKPKNESSFMSVPGSYNVLRLMNVSTTDAGTYKCVANNDVGHDEHLTELMVPEGTIDPYWFSFDPNVDALPNDAIVGGYENETLYIALAEHEESINPGIYVPSKHKAYITWGNDTHPKNSFKILRGDNYIWVPTTTGHIPVNAFRGGYIENTYETLYICKANYSGHVISGKVAVSQGACYIFYGGKTKPVRNFEILVVPEKRAARLTGKEIETVVDGQSVNIECHVTEGIPEPTISWEFKPKSGLKFVPIQSSDNVLRVSKADETDAGTYRCIASNDLGYDMHRTELIVHKKCIIPRESNYINTMPLILHTTVMPNDAIDNIEVEHGQTLKLSCPDSGNETNHFKMFPLRNEIRAHCVKGDEFIVKDKSYKLSDLVCSQKVEKSQKVEPAVVEKHKKCWTDKSELLGVGYGFTETYEVCFDTANNIPLYIPGKISERDRGGDVVYKWHKYRALDAHRDTYTCDNVTSTCCYSKAQLVNARDFSAGPPQRSTFMDPLNAVTLWRPCDLPQSPWEVMESTVRQLTAFKDEFKVWSGTYMPQNKNGTIIPRYLWKVVEKMIALIYINAPSPSTEDILCTNICGTSPPWPSEYKKYIYCCNLNDFLVRFGLEATNVGEPLPERSLVEATLLF